MGHVDVPGRRARRGLLGGRAAGRRPPAQRAAAVLHPRRGIEREVLPVCARHGIGVLVWSPLSGGWLTGKYRRDAPVPAGSRAETNAEHFDGGNAAKFDAVERLENDRRRSRAAARPPRAGVGRGAPGGDVRPHRRAHRGAARRPARRRQVELDGDCSTPSTTSSPPAPTSTPPTPAGPRPASPPRPAAAAPEIWGASFPPPDPGAKFPTVAEHCAQISCWDASRPEAVSAGSSRS